MNTVENVLVKLKESIMENVQFTAVSNLFASCIVKYTEN